MGTAALVFFAALSLNLLLNFALGLKELILRERTPAFVFYYPWIILFVSTLLLWVLFARILAFTGGMLNIVFIVPLSVLVSMALEMLLFRAFAMVKGFALFGKLKENPGIFSVGSSFSGLAAAALYLTLYFALTFTDALFLSLAFSAGSLLAFLIIKEIQKRSFLEAIPYGLRGTPILLISLGLLSLIFSAASVLFLKIFLRV